MSAEAASFDGSQPFRLSGGRLLDRSKRLRFEFNGECLTGFSGDTLASALLANGHTLMARSLRLHRPRGVLSCAMEEPNALVHVRYREFEEPNARATVVPLLDGMVVRSQNHWPTLRHDALAALDWLPRLWESGFFNKTFLWPGWKRYEPAIRALAGIGALRNPRASAGATAQRDLHCDVAIIGGGFSGVEAALASSRKGLDVIVMHARSGAGERYGGSAQDVSVRHLREAPGVRILYNTRAFGLYGSNVVAAVRETWSTDSGLTRTLFRVRARSIVVATGAIEQPLVFDNNDRPNVLLSQAVARYALNYAVLPGRNVLFATCDDSAYHHAATLRGLGVGVSGVLDLRPKVLESTLAVAAAANVQVRLGHCVSDTRGRKAVEAVCIRDLASGREAWEPCDLLAVSAGWSPSVALFSQGGGELRYAEELRAYVPASATMALLAVGSAAGDFDRARIVTRCAEVAAFLAAPAGSPATLSAPVLAIENRTPVGSALPIGGCPHRQWVDFQHDVTMSDLAGAVREGFTAVEHFKRYTTLGMAVDQGKTSSRNGLQALSAMTNSPMAQLRPPTYRPPFSPVSLGVLAGNAVGEFYLPLRRMPCHDLHEELGAEFFNAGGWLRPQRYSPPGAISTDDTIAEERAAVRNAVGLFEASPLGKIEVRGPDAAVLLNRLYINDLRTLQEGRIRYVIMLRENGTLLDDGTVTKIAPDHYLVTTTSGNSQRVFLWMREWAENEWTDLRVVVTDLTPQYAALTLAGPSSRALLQSLKVNADLSRDKFPHMSYRAMRIGDFETQVFRVSFTGECSYEIYVPGRQAPAFWEALADAGRNFGLRPFGIDALDALRTEKGFLHLGADTDSTTTPLDMGFGPLIARKTEDFVGRRSLSSPVFLSHGRLQFVGLKSLRRGSALRAGAHLVSYGSHRSCGYLTSVCWSPATHSWVALARLESGRDRMGQRLSAVDEGRAVDVEVVAPVFYDPRGDRLKS